MGRAGREPGAGGKNDDAHAIVRKSRRLASAHGDERGHRRSRSAQLDSRADPRFAPAGGSAFRLTEHAGWPSASRALDSSSIREDRTRLSWATGNGGVTKSSGFSSPSAQARSRSRSRSSCSRPSSSPTSSAPLRRLPSSVTAAGASCSSSITCGSGRQLVRYRGIELDTAGDGFFARFDGPARAIHCACCDPRVDRRARDRGPGGLAHRRVRADGREGCGDRRLDRGARGAQAQPGEVLVSQTVKDLVAGSGIGFDDRGAAELKGVPGEWRLYAVADS